MQKEVDEFHSLMKREAAQVNDYLSPLFDGLPEMEASETRLYSSISYSLNNGGKRFRPVLSLLVAKALGKKSEFVLPFAAAVEMIHTYSLIHDDLPSMDNDDFRRGEPSNHKKYGEAVALLAGDSLLTEAFHHLATHYREKPGVGLELVRLLSLAAGAQGMIGGQVIDVELLNGHPASVDLIKKVHEKKTGALIAVSVEGAAVACEVDAETRQKLKAIGGLIGFSFQVADDLLDHDPEKPEASSFPALMGYEETYRSLIKLSEQALSECKNLPFSTQDLEAVIKFNRDRVKPCEA